MISTEPRITIGIMERAREVRGSFNGAFEMTNSVRLRGPFSVRAEKGNVVLCDEEGVEVIRRKEITCNPTERGTFTLRDVIIGIHFHWERKEDQTFEGGLKLIAHADDTITVINRITIESYLQSVISSEMSAEAPIELLEAHAITSRSWLVAMLEREQRNLGVPSLRSRESDDEIVRWYDREDHSLFDVCADDHCQRYQGITKIISPAARRAIEATRGVFLVSAGQICDARFSKACGGRSEVYENCWEERTLPYLSSVSDASVEHPVIRSEAEAEAWIMSKPPAYCNTSDGRVLKQVLPGFDQETTDFYRWNVEYGNEELSSLILSKSGIDFGVLTDLIPVERGPSGRLVKLRIAGSKKTLTVGKELEIRRWLSTSHLYSSAFIVRKTKRVGASEPGFVLYGAGWGHGVGLCQIGAAIMASKGMSAETIVKHYFRSAEIQKLY